MLIALGANFNSCFRLTGEEGKTGWGRVRQCSASAGILSTYQLFCQGKKFSYLSAQSDQSLFRQGNNFF